jgi:dihydroorotase
VQGPMFDLPTTLSKFLNLGMSLPDVIDRATRRPALAIGKPELGTLQPGAPADVALFRLEEADVTFYDVEMNPRAGNRRLVCTMTMIDGQLLPQRAERAPAIWAILPEHQRRILDRG